MKFLALILLIGTTSLIANAKGPCDIPDWQIRERIWTCVDNNNELYKISYKKNTCWKAPWRLHNPSFYVEAEVTTEHLFLFHSKFLTPLASYNHFSESDDAIIFHPSENRINALEIYPTKLQAHLYGINAQHILALSCEEEAL